MSIRGNGSEAARGGRFEMLESATERRKSAFSNQKRGVSVLAGGFCPLVFAAQLEGQRIMKAFQTREITMIIREYNLCLWVG